MSVLTYWIWPICEARTFNRVPRFNFKLKKLAQIGVFTKILTGNDLQSENFAIWRKFSTTFSPLLLRNEKSALKKKKKAKKSEKNSSNYFGRGLNCSSAIPRRDEMDTGGEKSDNDIMMESTTSDSGKKCFFTVLQIKAKFWSFFEFQACWIP